MIVLDTNVTSELMKSSPDPIVRQWVLACRPQERFTTSITLAEVRYGIERMPAGRRRNALAMLADDAFAAFEGQVLSFDVAAAIAYPLIVTRRERAGLPVHAFDAQIASICRARGAALATRNLKDFEHTGIDLIDPWRAA